MTVLNYNTALEILMEHRSTEKCRRVANNTYLWAEGSCVGSDVKGSNVWDTEVDGPLTCTSRPHRISLSLHNNTIMTWERYEDYTHFPCNSLSNTTLSRYKDFSNFLVWRRGDAAFISLRGSQYVLPFPYARHLDNTTGALVESSEDWLNQYNVYELYEAAPKLARSLTLDLLGGRVSCGMVDFAPVAVWAEDHGRISNPDTVELLEQYRRTGESRMLLIMGLLEKTLHMSEYRPFLLSLRPGATYQEHWGARKRNLAQIAARELAGGVMRVHNAPVARPRDMYREIKESLMYGIFQALHTTT